MSVILPKSSADGAKFDGTAKNATTLPATSSFNQVAFDTYFAGKTTDDLSEGGTNKYDVAPLPAHTHTLADITDEGTAAAKNVPSSGDAAATEVVLGNDTRLTDSRTPTTHDHADATTSADGFMSAADKVKLDGVASGAEVNVQPDWNAASGDAQVLNKPTIPGDLGDLNDVSSTAPSTDQVLKWDGTEWAPGTDGGGSGGSGGHTLQDEGTSLTQRTKLNFIGELVEAVDTDGTIDATNITIDAKTAWLYG